MNGECPPDTHCEATTATCVPDVTPAVTGIRFTTPPESVEALADAAPVRAELYDSRGHLVDLSGAAVTLTLADAGWGVQILGTTTRATSAGQVSFEGLRFTAPGNNLRLVAHVGGVMAQSQPFDVSFTHPTIVMGDVAPVVTGCVSIPYTLTQAQARPVQLLVEVDPDGPSGPLPWVRARQAASPPGSAGVDGAPSSAAGRRQTFTWNSSVDLGEVDADVTLRMTPSIGDVLGSAASVEVAVRNAPRWAPVDTAVPGVSIARIADVDVDGWPDRVTLSGTVLAVRYGGPSSIEATWTLGATGRDVAFGDLDADGLVDLAVATDAGLELVHQLRAPRRQLGRMQRLGDSGSVRHVLTADLDHDGLLDLVVSETSGEVLAFRRRVDAPDRFVALGSVWSGGPSGRIAILDHADEGRAEIVIGRPDAAVAFVELRGGVVAAPRLDAFLTGAEVAVTDLDRNFAPDVAALGEDGLRVRLGGDTSAEAGPFSEVTGENAAFGDIDGDGRMDVVVATGTTLVAHPGLDNPGAPGLSFSPPITIGTTGTVTAAALVDFDRDGRTDVIVARPGADVVTTYRFDGARRCGGRIGGPIATGARALPDRMNGYPQSAPYVVTDFNGDGKVDLVQFDAVGQPYGLSISEGRGDGTFEAPRLLWETERTVTSFSIADLDGDGYLDVVYAKSSPGLGVNVLFNQPTMPGSFQELSLATSSCATEIADVDGDGILDVVTLDHQANRVFRRRAPHTRSFDDVSALPPIASSQVCLNLDTRVRVVDLDGDGRPEIVFVGTDQQAVYPTDPNEAGSFLDPVVSDHAQSSFVAITDVVGDAKPELVLGRFRATESRYRLQAYSFTSDFETADEPDWTVSFPEDVWESSVTTAAVGDLDHDGKSEVIVSMGDHASDGMAIFTPRDLSNGDMLPQDRLVPINGRPGLADVDGDGIPDLVSGSYVVRALDDHGTFDKGIWLGALGADPSAGFGAPYLAPLDGPLLEAIAPATGSLRSWRCPRTSGPCMAGGSIASAEPVLVSDLDDDGQADVLGHDPSGRLAFVAEPADGVFAPVCPGAATLRERAVGDLDLDGRPDLIVTSGLSVQWIQAPATTCSAPETLVVLPATTNLATIESVALADMNADGRPDLVITGPGLSIALQSSEVPLSFPQLEVYAPGSDQYYPAAVGDVDRDGLPDVLVAGTSGYVLYVSDESAPGALSLGAAIPATPGVPLTKATFADADGDGWLDVFFPGNGQVFLQDGHQPPHFSLAYGVLGTDSGVDWPGLVDFDGDGRLDELLWRYGRGIYVMRGR